MPSSRLLRQVLQQTPAVLLVLVPPLLLWGWWHPAGGARCSMSRHTPNPQPGKPAFSKFCCIPATALNQPPWGAPQAGTAVAAMQACLCRAHLLVGGRLPRGTSSSIAWQCSARQACSRRQQGWAGRPDRPGGRLDPARCRLRGFDADRQGRRLCRARRRAHPWRRRLALLWGAAALPLRGSRRLGGACSGPAVPGTAGFGALPPGQADLDGGPRGPVGQRQYHGSPVAAWLQLQVTQP